MYVFNVVAIAISLFDIWLLQRISGSIQMGYYGLSYSIVAMCFMFTSAMTPIIMREFSKYLELKDLETVRILFKKYVPMLYSIAAYFGIFIAFHSEDLLLIFADERYLDAYFALVIMSFYPIHQTYGQLNAALMFSAEKVIIYRNIGMFFAVLGLFMTFLMLYFYEKGAEGLALKMVVVQFLSVNVQLYYNSKYLNVRWLEYLYHQLISISMFTFVAYITKFSIYEDRFANFFFSGFIYSLICLLLLLFFPKLFGLKSNSWLFKCVKK